MRIAFRVDSSKNIGSGHLFRCVKIANYFYSHGAKIDFLISDISDSFLKVIPFKFNIIKIRNNFGKKKRAIIQNHFKTWDKQMIIKDTSYLSKITKKKYDWLIIDHYGLDINYHIKSYDYAQKVIVVDDLCKKNFCDIYINYQLYDKRFIKKKFFLKKNTTKFIGLKYNISNYKYKYLVKNNFKKNIFLSMGSVDSKNKLYMILKKIKSLKENKFNFYLYLPPTIKNFQSILKFVKKLKNITVFKKPIVLEKIYPKIDFVISALNTTFYEQLKYGFKPLVVCQNDNQNKQLKRLLDKKIVNYIKLDDHFKVKFENLISNKRNFYLSKNTYKKNFNISFYSKLSNIIFRKQKN